MPRLVNDDTSVHETDNLRAYQHHGLDLNEHGSQCNGECPFCGKEKFSVNIDSGLWRCWVCGRTGNPLEFLRQLWDVSVKSTDLGWLEQFAEERKLLFADTMRSWGVCKSVVDGTWLVPGYSINAELVQLYRRVQVQGSDGVWSWCLQPTPGVWPAGKAHALHMCSADFSDCTSKSNTDRSTLMICEGLWDGMALWEIACRCKLTARGVELCDQRESLASESNIVAVPGCNVWQPVWTEMCRNRRVVLMYDNDHPIEHNGSVTMAGYDGMKRVAGKVASVAESINFLRWGESGYDPVLESGYDVRDALARGID